MNQQLHTTTIQMACDVEIIVPQNFDDSSHEEKVKIVTQNILNNYITNYEICYIDEVKDAIPND
jgi:hypothetical protein